MKKGQIISIVISSVCLLAVPLSVASVGFICPPQYDETYFGELPYMFNRLKNGKEVKIIIVGNSAVAFASRNDLLEKELNKEVVTFGLYGAIGTKAMMDLSKVGIKKNDTVILSPEISEQGLSLYFSAENMWMAVDGHYDMLPYIAKENSKAMVGKFASFTSNKLEYVAKGQKPKVDGVYQQSSFNLEGQEVGYMTYERGYNIMVNGFDSNSPIAFNKELLSDDFVSYMNDYAKYVRNKGASIYYNFVPCNSLAVISSREEIDEFYDALQSKISFPILGNPHSYIFDFDWFYDNNSHLNSAGTYLYNYQLVEDLKLVNGDASPTNIAIPEKPEIPLPDFEDGDNSDLDCFNYEVSGDGYQITSLTDIGKERTTLIIPSTYNGRPIISFSVDTFKNNKVINQVIVPTNTRTLGDYAFEGCSNLAKIIIQHDSPNKINVGTSLLEGADNCNVYVKEAVYDIFTTHYNWGYYRDRLRKY